MKIDILTLFPKMFSGPFKESIIKRAVDKEFVKIDIHDLRKWTTDKHRSVDDRPFGGGVGMIMKVDVIEKAVRDLKSKSRALSTTKVILLDAGGKKFSQKKAMELSRLDHLIFIAGHYEGVDYRIHKYIADEIISIGDYILTGGEIPTMVLIDSIVRLVPGVIVKSEATKYESFYDNLLEYPQYTRPEKYLEWKVPKVLLSGNHKEIEQWKKDQSITKTKKLRPDIIKKN